MDKIYDHIYLKRIQLLLKKTKDYSYKLFASTIDDVILDIGCGIGTDVSNLSKNGAKVYGIDVEEDLIKYAKNNNHQFLRDNFFISSAASTPFANESITKVRFDRVLQHISDHGKVFKEAKRILKVKGKIQIIDTDYLSLNLFLTNLKLEANIINSLAYKRLEGGYKIRQIPLKLRENDFTIESITVHNYIINNFDDANKIIRLDKIINEQLILGEIDVDDCLFWEDHKKRKGEFNMSFNIMIIMATKN